MEANQFFSSTLLVGIESISTFNVIGHLEGPNRSFLRYIEEETKSKITVYNSTSKNGTDDSNQISITVISEDEEGLKKAENLCQDLIKTVKAQRQKHIYEKDKKRSKKRKNQGKLIDLPQQLLLGMRYYYPGPSSELPPPGSSGDLKLHRRNFRQIGKQNGWFQNTEPVYI